MVKNALSRSPTNQPTNLHLLILWEHVWNFAAVEDVVDVLHKTLVLDLRVAEEEDCGLVFSTSTPQHLSQVIAPLDLGVALADLNLR